ncbi:MAG: hypothetical protein ABFQ82_06315 [Thermodesulfobacteriota bacterium]
MPSIITQITIIFLLLTSIAGCGRDREESSPSVEPISQSTVQPAIKPGCLSCHPFSLDEKHQQLACTSCHNGDNETADPETAHQNLIARPAHPDNMAKSCGGCHDQTGPAASSLHFTLKNEINQIRRHFGATTNLQSLPDIPQAKSPSSPLELADDLLRRRCLRCHVYYEGDEYSGTRRGTGCAACHLEFQDGQLATHRFIAKPADRQCLSCHYGNRVGGDYYGRFDHDFKHEYRTPYQADSSYPLRPYGVEQHQLSPDVHQKAGMICIDCHTAMHGGEQMATTSCGACHLPEPGHKPTAGNIIAKRGKLHLQSSSGKLLSIPIATNPAHDLYRGKAACAVCHARWSYTDLNTHLLRIDNDAYEEWDDLFIQDSSEVEEFLLNAIYGDGDPDPVMFDKITGEMQPGIWLKGFKTRRWETPIIAADQKGKLQIMRPVLDLNISYLDATGETGFDSLTGQNNGLRPYTPHTIGKAGAFYRQRFPNNQNKTTD